MKEKCPKCGEQHEHQKHNECNCCGEKSVEIGIHYPVLCHECSKALSKVRSRLNPCPNCGQGAGQTVEENGYKCKNRNCRVNFFESEGQHNVYDKILELRGIEA